MIHDQIRVVTYQCWNRQLGIIMWVHQRSKKVEWVPAVPVEEECSLLLPRCSICSLSKWCFSLPTLHSLPSRFSFSSSSVPMPLLSLKVQWQWGENNKLLHSLPYTPLSHPKLLSLFMMIILFFCHHQRWKLRWIRRKSNKEMLHPFPVLHPSYFMKNKTWEVAIDKRSSTLPMLWWEVTIDNKNRSSTFPMLLCQFFPYHLPNAPP